MNAGVKYDLFVRGSTNTSKSSSPPAWTDRRELLIQNVRMVDTKLVEPWWHPSWRSLWDSIGNAIKHMNAYESIGKALEGIGKHRKTYGKHV